ncbi:hypothetical protein SLEP1_g51372 [Rubroshorea leprosula]|uniref:DUF241 domain protein n=1 Tax=Rubroshorea leprosula TaxID=152421 RepID=A0AAV5M2Z5_9ROSI|nr:hypothetical protein SLEP1_g51372 [Rubroshorea leprosula]
MASKCNLRSISLPSRPHPSTLRIEEELNRIKTGEGSSASTSGSICLGLSGLEELYHCMDDLLNMASTQQVLSKHQQEKCVDEFLDGSVRLLDVCGIARDIVFQVKEQIHALQSALRRRKGDSSIEKSIVNYTSFRKKMKKEAKKLIVTLKQMDNKIGASTVLDQDHHFLAVIRVLRELNSMNISIFQSLFSFLAAPVPGKQTTWSLVSKLMHKGTVACEQENVNEFETVDAVLCRRSSNVEKMQTAQKRLEALESSIQGLEDGLESLFRRLVKARASLLNILSQ